ALRARGDERRLDGLRRRADRGREDRSLASRGDVRGGGDPARPGAAPLLGTARGPGAHDPAGHPDAPDGADGPVTARDAGRLSVLVVVFGDAVRIAARGLRPGLGVRRLVV